MDMKLQSDLWKHFENIIYGYELVLEFADSEGKSCAIFIVSDLRILKIFCFFEEYINERTVEKHAQDYANKMGLLFCGKDITDLKH